MNYVLSDMYWISNLNDVMLNILYCTLCSVYTVQCVHCTMCTLYTVIRTLYIMYSIQCTAYNLDDVMLNIIQCIMNQTPNTLHLQVDVNGVHCTLYIVQCTLYTVHVYYINIQRNINNNNNHNILLARTSVHVHTFTRIQARIQTCAHARSHCVHVDGDFIVWLALNRGCRIVVIKSPIRPSSPQSPPFTSRGINIGGEGERRTRDPIHDHVV